MAFDHHQHALQTPLVHVGYPKSLSSWMQKFLFKPEQGFINVLDSLCTTISVIDPSPFSFNESTAIDFMAGVLDRHPDHKNLVPVCSAEALVGNPYCGGYNAKQNADRLKLLFPEAKILLVVREQRSLIRSLYKTMVVWGMPHTIKRLLAPRDASLAPQFNLDFLRFDLPAAYYQQLFGPSNVLVLPYEAFIAAPQAFTLEILQHAGITPGESFNRLPWKKRININQPLLNIYIQRISNLFLSSPFNYSGPIPSTEQGVAKRIRRSKKNTLPDFTKTWFEKSFSDTVKKAFAGQFGESNKKLQQLTGLDLAAYGYELHDETSGHEP